MHKVTAPQSRVRTGLRLSAASVVLGLATVSVAVLPAQVAGATSPFVVTNCNSTGPGSLAAEVALANAGPNTVTFAPVLSSCASKTIIPTGTITINNDITITGPGASVLAVSGNHAFSVFSVTSGVTTGATISGLTIENGFAAQGGGIDNLGSLRLTNDVVSGNATQSGANGSGSTAVTINASTTTLNFGGGNGGDGGGIFSAGILVLTNDTISSNTTGSGGSGPTGSTSTITGNDDTITQGAGNGGSGAGLYNTGSVVLSGDTFSKNSTGAGGAGESDTTMTFSGDNDTTLQGGGSGGSGGGIFSTGSLRLTNTTVAGDSTGSGGNDPGSGIFDQTGNNDTLIQSVGSGGNGGGLFVGGSFSLSNGTVSGNVTGGPGLDSVAVDSVLTGTNDFSFQTGDFMGLGGGVFSFGTGTIEATIVANSGTGRDCASASAMVTDEGYNLDDDGSCEFSGVNASPSPTLDATLGSLANNGGPTQTIALLSNSPAIDKVPAADCPATDQRGAPRTAPCDIGAYDTDFPSLFCPTGTTYFLTATYATGSFYGVFCVNANGDGTYTQYSPGLPVNQQTLTGTGHIRMNQGVTSIQAYLPTFKNLNLVGTTNGTASSFGESGSGFPHLSGTFTLAENPPPTLSCPTPTGFVGIAYSSAFVATGGAPPYVIRFLSDSNESLGLASAPTGAITGVPEEQGSTTIAAQVTDSTGRSTTTSCSITISPT
jgi:hypothetical protein